MGPGYWNFFLGENFQLFLRLYNEAPLHFIVSNQINIGRLPELGLSGQIHNLRSIRCFASADNSSFHVF